MKVTIDIPDLKTDGWEFEKIVKEGIRDAIKDRIELLDEKGLALEVCQVVADYVKHGINGPLDNNSIALTLDKRIGEMIMNIDDDFLRNALTQRLLTKID